MAAVGSTAENRRRSKGQKGTPQRGKSVQSTQGAKSNRDRNAKEDVFSKVQNPPFEEYWSKEDVSAGLKTRQLIKGIVRINRKNFMEAYIDDPAKGPDYFLSGVLTRNRALEGDVVAVQVLPSDQWEPCPPSSIPTIKAQVPSDTSQKAEQHDPPNDIAEAMSAVGIADHDPHSPSEERTQENTKETLIDRLYTVEPAYRKKPSSSPPAPLMIDGKDLTKFRRTAKVVYIIETGHSRACAGIIKAYNKEKDLALLSPNDTRLPRVVLPLKDCPDDLSQNFKKYETTLFICIITDWPADSPLARGKLMRSLGEAGEIEPETESILRELEIDFDEFPASVLECLPTAKPWRIPVEEEKKRRDFRDECVVSIDPSTARDLDDALHCKELKPGVYEVGVHIADVSYFVQPGTSLDEMASRRATSVYLVQKVVPMLPRKLCEDLCSLNPNEDRLSFSVVWTLSANGELLNEWMGRSIICSKAKLSYDHAQMMIDKPDHPWQHTDFPIADGQWLSTIISSVNTLNKLAKKLRYLRESRGTLRLDQMKLAFTLDRETGLPNGCRVYQQKESNKLIEEFMLLANMAVAHRISKSFPDTSLLRRHPQPKDKSIELLRAHCLKLGVSLNTSSAGAMQDSINWFSSKVKKTHPEVAELQRAVLISLCCKTMELARYFCTGAVEEESDFHHYALNVPRYTHFTSPIRRYPDVLVHRLLAAALGEGPPFTLKTEEVEEHSIHCNKKKKDAKTADELSIQLFLGVFVKECGPLSQQSMVTAVLDKSFDVLMPQFGTVYRVYCKDLPLQAFFFEIVKDTQLPCLHLVWSDESVSDKTMQAQDINVFSPVNIALTTTKGINFKATITPPETQ